MKKLREGLDLGEEEKINTQTTINYAKAKKTHKHEGHHRLKNIRIAAILNIGFTVFEFVGGLLTNSMAVLSDALHDIGDSFVLVISHWIEGIAVRKKPDVRRTFGYRRLSLIAAVFNAAILIAGSLLIIWFASARLLSPQPVSAVGVVLLSIVGIIANSAAAIKLHHGRSLNERVLSWHLFEDMFSWLAILLIGMITYFTQLYILDAAISIVFAVFILFNVWRNTHNVFNLLLEGAPTNVDLGLLAAEINRLGEVDSIHDVHLWSLDNDRDLFSCHAVIKPKYRRGYNMVKRKIERILKKHKIEHATIQLEDRHTYKELGCRQEFLGD